MARPYEPRNTGTPTILPGDRYGKWKTLSGPIRVKNENWWDCICECGTKKRVRAQNLRNGTTRSCGCQRHAHQFTHRMSKTPEYYAWRAMMNRCTNPKFKQWSRWGGRGISVCFRWRKFENFFSDMGRRPSPKHSLDRYPDNDGNYKPSNCRWATKKQQNNNTSRNRLLLIGGEIMTVAQAIERFEVKK